MEVLIWYLIGVLILGVSHYIYLACVHENETIQDSSKKLMLYRSIKFGLLSWLGIIIGIAVICTGIIFGIDEWVEDKLK